MATTKRVRIFAGPNGSGKSTLKEIIAPLFSIGYYINADEMLQTMRNTSRLEFSDYGLTVDEQVLEAEYAKWPIETDHDLWNFENNGITVKNGADVEGYFVSFLADFVRNSLLGVADRFSFETVMSHESKLEFIKRAKEAGYKTYLYFVSLPDPRLNQLRVQTRVQAGGHDVDSEKVLSRYYRTMEFLFEAVKLVDNAYLFDNSASKPQLFARKENGELKTDGVFVPSWYQTYVLDRLKENN